MEGNDVDLTVHIVCFHQFFENRNNCGILRFDLNKQQYVFSFEFFEELFQGRNPALFVFFVPFISLVDIQLLELCECRFFNFQRSVAGARRIAVMHDYDLVIGGQVNIAFNDIGSLFHGENRTFQRIFRRF